MTTVVTNGNKKSNDGADQLIVPTGQTDQSWSQAQKEGYSMNPQDLPRNAGDGVQIAAVPGLQPDVAQRFLQGLNKGMAGHPEAPLDIAHALRTNFMAANAYLDGFMSDRYAQAVDLHAKHDRAGAAQMLYENVNLGNTLAQAISLHVTYRAASLPRAEQDLG